MRKFFSAHASPRAGKRRVGAKVSAEQRKGELLRGRRLRCLCRKFCHVRWLGNLSMLEGTIQRPKHMRVHQLPARLWLLVH